MLDARWVAENPELARTMLRRRNAREQAFAALDELAALTGRRRALQTETDQLRAEHKRRSQEVGLLFKQKKVEEANQLREEIRRASETLDALEEERKQSAEREQALLLELPNLLDERVPDGTSDSDNVEVRRWGTPRTLDFTPREHDDLGSALGLFDFERAAKLSGARFSVLRGLGARLERSIINLFVDRAVDAGYTEMMVPYIVSRETLTGTGQLPKFEEDQFRLSAQVNGGDAFLIPTAEVPLTGLHGDEILDAAQLPLRFAAFTPCFRAEAGSYGRDTRGLIRQHQFHKVELVHVTTPEQSEAEHQRLVGHAESLLQALELPYRVMMLSSGDIGFGARLCYDLEVWLPGQNAYREISSCSNCGDFQARRLRLRYKGEDAKKASLCHTLNGSGLAVGRTLVAVIENYQQADGSIVVPDVLRPYMGVDRIPGLQ